MTGNGKHTTYKNDDLGNHHKYYGFTHISGFSLGDPFSQMHMTTRIFFGLMKNDRYPKFDGKFHDDQQLDFRASMGDFGHRTEWLVFFLLIKTARWCPILS